MRPGLLLSPCLLLCAPALGAQEVPRIDHAPLACLLKDRYPLISAVIEPAASVVHARVYFTSSSGDDYYFVEMAPNNGRLVGKLPKPREKASPVVYFIEVLSLGGELQRTPETRLQVVKNAEACPNAGSVAEALEKGDVTIVASTESTKKPNGFSGVARVTSLSTAQAAADSGASGEPSAGAPTPAEAAPQTVASPPPPILATPTPAPSLQPSAEPSAPQVVRPAVLPGEFPLGAEDIVKVTVIGHDDLTLTLIVQSDGSFIFPLLGRVKVAELTPKELEKRLAELLGKGLIRNPQISVTVQEYKSKTVMVMGEVARPGPYPMTGNMRIIEVLARAGMNINATTEVQIIRPLVPIDRPLLPAEVTGAEGALKQAEILKVDLRQIQGGDLDKNISLLPNDTVYVPPAAKFYVTGETRNTGAFAFQPGLSFREAVILAGGFSDNAASGRLRVIREQDGKKRELKVKADDIVQPGDIIVVKGKLF